MEYLHLRGKTVIPDVACNYLLVRSRDRRKGERGAIGRAMRRRSGGAVTTTRVVLPGGDATNRRKGMRLVSQLAVAQRGAV
jgi:hypothetical protein